MFKYIIYYFDLKLPEGLEPVAQLGFNVGLVSLSALFCFINVFGYLISIYLVKYYDVEKKYPKFRKWFNYFNKTSIFFLIVESIIGFGSLIGLIYLGFLPLFRY